MISINSASKLVVKKKKNNKLSTKSKSKQSKRTKKLASKRGKAPELVPKTLNNRAAIVSISSLPPDEQQIYVNDLFRQALGYSSPLFGSDAGITAPRASSTTADRRSAAADLAILTKELGVIYILKKCRLLEQIDELLMPNGIAAVFGNEQGSNPGGGMRKITSSISLASMGSVDSTARATNATSSIISDSKRGKTVVPEAREGCLLSIRAIAEIVGKTAEPFLVPLLAATLEECCSSSGMVREAAEDSAVAIVNLVSTHAVSLLICPVVFEALESPEWRVKAMALDILAQCAAMYPNPVSRILPKIIPVVTGQVWDTKPQVTKAAASALMSCCETNANPDIAPAIPAVVNAIMKPADTVKAIDELKGTTFVATVDASTLSILCPVLSRGLKDRMAMNKRSCCIVIENMSRLVETPEAVAPFGPLLIPELKKVAENVQFDEIRDAALAALAALTKALGHSSVEDALTNLMKEENERIAAEQKRIEDERVAEEERQEKIRQKEEEEKKLWREAMEAQRLLEKIALEQEEEKKAEEAKKKQIQKKSTKGITGKCQGCGLKKCKKTCLFAN